MKTFFRNISVAFLYFVCSDIYAQTKTIEKIVAVVGNDIVLKSEVDARVQFYSYQNNVKVTPPELEKQMLETIIEEKLLLAKAERDSIKTDADMIAMEANKRLEYLKSRVGSESAVKDFFGKSIQLILVDIKQQIRNQQLVAQTQQKIVSGVSVSNKDVEEFYNLRKDSLPELPAQVEIARILLLPTIDSTEKTKAYKKMLEIQKKLSDGESFEALAKEFSQDAGSAVNGGDLGFVKRGEFVKNFDAEIFRLREKEISPIVETEFGFHIIQVLERRGETVKSRHILIRFDKSKINTESSLLALKEIKQKIKEKEISFALAARLYSKDETSANRGGDIIDVNTKSNRINVKDLSDEMKEVVEKLNAGEISDPVPTYVAEKEMNAHQLIYLKIKTKPHRMNLEQDYTLLQNAALQYRQMDVMKKTIQKLKDEIYWTLK